MCIVALSLDLNCLQSKYLLSPSSSSSSSSPHGWSVGGSGNYLKWPSCLYTQKEQHHHPGAPWKRVAVNYTLCRFGPPIHLVCANNPSFFDKYLTSSCCIKFIFKIHDLFTNMLGHRILCLLYLALTMVLLLRAPLLALLLLHSKCTLLHFKR